MLSLLGCLTYGNLLLPHIILWNIFKNCIDVLCAYLKMYVSYMHHLMKCHRCILLCNHHTDQDVEYFQWLERLSLFLFHSVFSQLYKILSYYTGSFSSSFGSYEWDSTAGTRLRLACFLNIGPMSAIHAIYSFPLLFTIALVNISLYDRPLHCWWVLEVFSLWGNYK